MSEIQPFPDAELVAAYLAGDRGAFADIYDRYAHRIFSYNLAMLGDREVAADVTHDAFIEAAARMAELGDPAKLEAWLFTISANLARIRGRELSGFTIEDAFPEALVDQPDLGLEEEPTEPTTPAPPALRPRVLNKVDKGVGPTPATTPPQEWAQLGLVAAVALIVGLVGLGVSALFDPIPAPPLAPVAENPAVPGSSTTSTTIPGSASITSNPFPTTTGASAPAAIEASTDTVDMGGDGSVGGFDLTNTGGRPGTWTLVSSTEAITLSATEGELAAGDSLTIDMSLDREQIEEGDISETLTVTWSGGQIPISVTGTNEANPIIHNPQASPPSVQVSGDSACSNTQTTVSARIRDASPLESVVVRWSPDGNAEQETPMSPAGEEMFDAVIGPFTSVHTASVRIVAFDERGNAGGATTQVAVVACP